MTPELSAEGVVDWRNLISPPCACPPRPSTDECPRVEECYEAWCRWQEGVVGGLEEHGRR